MFLARYPSPRLIERFLGDCRELALSYAGPIRLMDSSHGLVLDDALVPIGRGVGDFARAREALRTWKQFDMAWVQVFPHDAAVQVGTNVAVLFRHLGFWSLNGSRILYEMAAEDQSTRFGFAYGTLSNHAIAGEELFEVYLDETTGTVFYRIRATSSPYAPLARLGLPIVRALQRRFRRESAEAMKRALNAGAATPRS